MLEFSSKLPSVWTIFATSGCVRLALLFIVMNMNRKAFISTNWIEPVVEIVR